MPTACGGGFGGKLDLSVQPLVPGRLEAGHPVAWLTRPRSMAASTKPTPASRRSSAARRRQAPACDVTATDTGAYASWGPTVANRVPVHAMGLCRAQL